MWITQHTRKIKTAATAATVRRLGAHTGTHKSTDKSISGKQQKSNENFSVPLCERHRTLRQYRRYELSFNKWPKRSAEKNLFYGAQRDIQHWSGLPGRYPSTPICSGARIVKTYQCYPSYKTIGHAIGMSENTVAKYVRQLEEKGLIYTEPTIMQRQRRKTAERESALHHSSYPGCTRSVL